MLPDSEFSSKKLYMRQKAGWWVPGAGKRNGQLEFNGYRVLVLQIRLPEMDGCDGCIRM